MMKILNILALVALMMPFSAYAYGNLLGEPVEGNIPNLDVVPVRDNIHMLVSPHGGNVAVSTGEDGIFIIDDQLQGRSKIIEDGIKQLSDKPVSFILNTHYHFDHTGGNEFFGGQGGIIVAQDNVRKRLSSLQFITYFGRGMQPLAKEGLPVVTFADGMTLHYNGDDIRIIHVPHAHTDGDAIAHFAGKNVIVTGDIIFNDTYPFIDVEHGGSVKGVIAALDMIIGLADEDTLIIPGHGPLMHKPELLAYREMLSTVTERVEAAIKQGRTLDEVIAARPTREFDSSRKEGVVSPDGLVSLLYDDLTHGVK